MNCRGVKEDDETIFVANTTVKAPQNHQLNCDLFGRTTLRSTLDLS